MMAYDQIGSAGEPRDLLGTPAGRAVTKERTRLHPVDRDETLRINGRARLLRDAPWFGQMAVRGQRPILALLVRRLC